MKKLMISFIAVGSAFFLYSTESKLGLDFGIGYNSIIPMSNMRSNLNSAHGKNLEINYRIKKTPFSIGLDLGMSFYGSKKEPIALQFDEFSPVTHTNITVGNNLNSVFLNTKTHFFESQRLIKPYIMSGFGMLAYNAGLTIDDPDDFDNCQPLVSKFIHRDKTWSLRNGVGLQIDLAFKNKSNRDLILLDINIHHFLGGKVSYMGHINDGIANAYLNGNYHPTPHHNHQRMPRGVLKSVMAEFENIPTGQIHEHAVGEIFVNRINKIGVQARFV